MERGLAAPVTKAVKEYLTAAFSLVVMQFVQQIELGVRVCLVSECVKIAAQQIELPRREHRVLGGHESIQIKLFNEGLAQC